MHGKLFMFSQAWQGWSGKTIAGARLLKNHARFTLGTRALRAGAYGAARFGPETTIACLAFSAPPFGAAVAPRSPDGFSRPAPAF
jgi:hypothetical protein